MQINLMPVIPKTKRFKFPIFLLVVILVVCASGLVASDVYQKLGIYNTEKEAYNKIAAERTRLEQQLVANREEGKIFADYYSKFNDVQQGNYDITHVFDSIAALLPEKGAINQLTLTEDGHLSLNLELPGVLTASQLIQIFINTPWVLSVNDVTSAVVDKMIELELNLTVDLDALLKEEE